MTDKKDTSLQSENKDVPVLYLKDLKRKKPQELVALAEEAGVENASSLLKQDIIYGLLKKMSEIDGKIISEGTLELLQDGFGFLRSQETNYLAGPDDIYVSPAQVRKFGLRTGDSVEGEVRAPKTGERYFSLMKVNKVNFEDPETGKHKINFDNLIPLYPDRKIIMESP